MAWPLSADVAVAFSRGSDPAPQACSQVPHRHGRHHRGTAAQRHTRRAGHSAPANMSVEVRSTARARPSCSAGRGGRAPLHGPLRPGGGAPLLGVQRAPARHGAGPDQHEDRQRAGGSPPRPRSPPAKAEAEQQIETAKARRDSIRDPRRGPTPEPGGRAPAGHRQMERRAAHGSRRRNAVPFIEARPGSRDLTIARMSPPRGGGPAPLRARRASEFASATPEGDRVRRGRLRLEQRRSFTPSLNTQRRGRNHLPPACAARAGPYVSGTGDTRCDQSINFRVRWVNSSATRRLMN